MQPVVTLTFPTEATSRFLLDDGSLIGPLSLDGNLTYVGSTASYRCPHDYIDENGDSYYGDNPLSNLQINGLIRYQPILPQLRPLPTAAYPRKVSVTLRRANGTLYSPLTLSYGVRFDTFCGIISYLSGYYTHEALRYLAPNKIQITKVSGKWDPIRLSYVVNLKQVRTLTLSPKTADTLSVRVERYTYYTGSDMISNIDWTTPQTIEAIEQWIPEKVSKVVYAPQTVTGTLYYVVNNGESASKILRDIEFELNRLRGMYDFPLFVDFGDLAMAASSKVVLNKVNLFEFIKDARHPTDLIPKLKNLSKLKGLKKIGKKMSEEYLRLKYGVLPTMDDLFSIVDTFKSIRPFLDKNGFTLQTARASDTIKYSDAEFSIEQHIKLAIDKEDSDLERFVQDAENQGFWPRMEYIWDLVPFSFLIDWFVNLGGFLERIDANSRLNRLNIRYVTMSNKRTITHTFMGGDSYTFSGTVCWVDYHRWVTDHCPRPQLSLQVPLEDFSHWLESTALIVQRIK